MGSLLSDRRRGRGRAYRPVLSDWVSNIALPATAYVALIVSAAAARSHAREALFGVGAGALLWPFVGIHNGWDAIAYHVMVRRADRR
jgi:hypothetical protein